jgi:hypothetical protein
MKLAVHEHVVANELLGCGTPEAVIRAEYCDTPCQIRMDWYVAENTIAENPEAFTDLKTCDDLDFFEQDARRWGYIYQLAFYQAVLEAKTRLTADVYLIGVEKKEPHRVGVWRVAQPTLASARYENEAAIRRLKSCLLSNRWPTGYEELRIFAA